MSNVMAALPVVAPAPGTRSDSGVVARGARDGDAYAAVAAEVEARATTSTRDTEGARDTEGGGEPADPAVETETDATEAEVEADPERQPDEASTVPAMSIVTLPAGAPATELAVEGAVATAPEGVAVEPLVADVISDGAPARPASGQPTEALATVPGATVAEVAPVEAAATSEGAPVEGAGPLDAEGPASTPLAPADATPDDAVAAPADASPEAGPPAESIAALAPTTRGETGPAAPPAPNAPTADPAAGTSAAGAAAAAAPATTGTSEAAPMDTGMAPGPAAPTDADPWEQVATVVRPLRTAPDGTHRLSLQLRPAELGTVHLEVAVNDGRLSVRAVADNLVSRDALVAALPELRAELTGSGIDLGSVDVGERTGQGSADPRDQDRPGAARTGGRSAGGSPVPGAATPLEPTSTVPAGTGRLDLAL